MQRSLVCALLVCFVGWVAFVAQAQEGALTFPRPQEGQYDPAMLADIDLSALPILPEWTATAQAVYSAGLAEGNVPNRFSKVGDCMTASASFLVPFAGQAGVDYDLGEYAELQSVVDYFSVPARDEGFERNSWGNEGLGTQSGFNTSSLTDWLFADPKWCDVNESPLECEYRVSRASFALIMLGTNDITFFDEAQFDYAMRAIVYTTLERHIVPVLHTFPLRPEYPEKTVTFNKIIAAIASDYDVPLINLWLAIDDLPFNGVDEKEPIHLSLPEDGKTAFLDEARLQYGYNVRNLLTLQALAGFLEAIEAQGE